MMTEKEAWLYLASLFRKYAEDTTGLYDYESENSITKAGICFASGRLTMTDKIDWDTRESMGRKIEHINPEGGYLFPFKTDELNQYLPEHSIKRAEICERFASELP